MQQSEFDRSRLLIEPLSERQHDLNLSMVRPLESVEDIDVSLSTVAEKLRIARDCGASNILMMGAHVLRSGMQKYLIDLMERGYISCIAVNGAGVVHDFELALVGGTTESVARYIKDGRFGLWQETGRINDIVVDAAAAGNGLGSAVGQVIEEEKFPFCEHSLLAAGYRLGIPVTVHVGLGYDIVHEFPNCDGAAYGATSYRDFLRFAKILEGVEKGVVMNFGSAIMAPEIYLKALSMVRNVARQQGREITDFTSLVCDLADLPTDFRNGPSKDDPAYYFRPWKTMLVRTVADGGESFYVKGRHAETIPQLWTALDNASKGENDDLE